MTDPLGIWVKAMALKIEKAERDPVHIVYENEPARPTEPEGLAVAMERLRRDFRAWIARDFLTPAERRYAKRDLRHAFVNVHVEALREWGFRQPKMAGKALVAAEIGALVAAVAWIILIFT